MLSIVVALVAAANSALLQWRDPVYIIAGFAGIIALALLLIQPLLALGYLPGISNRLGRSIHRWLGVALVTAVLVHVIALYMTSPPDVVDALLFASPTTFSLWGVIAMWVVFASAMLAAYRRRLRPRTWRIAHTALGVVIVIATVVHAILIDGTMGYWSKLILCVLVVIAMTGAVIERWIKPSLSQRDV